MNWKKVISRIAKVARVAGTVAGAVTGGGPVILGIAAAARALAEETNVAKLKPKVQVLSETLEFIGAVRQANADGQITEIEAKDLGEAAAHLERRIKEEFFSKSA